MGKKPVLAVAAALMTGLALTGCQNNSGNRAPTPYQPMTTKGPAQGPVTAVSTQNGQMMTVPGAPPNASALQTYNGGNGSGVPSQMPVGSPSGQMGASNPAVRNGQIQPASYQPNPTPGAYNTGTPTPGFPPPSSLPNNSFSAPSMGSSVPPSPPNLSSSLAPMPGTMMLDTSRNVQTTMPNQGYGTAPVYPK